MSAERSPVAEVAAEPPAIEEPPEEAAQQEPQAEEEVRCTICGLPACWRA